MAHSVSLPSYHATFTTLSKDITFFEEDRISPEEDKNVYTNNNKQFAYSCALNGCENQSMKVSKVVMHDRLGALGPLSFSIFNLKKPLVAVKDGGYEFPNSTADKMHWTAIDLTKTNSWQSSNMYEVDSDLFTNRDITILQHPVLFWFHEWVRQDRNIMRKDTVEIVRFSRCASKIPNKTFEIFDTLYDDQRSSILDTLLFQNVVRTAVIDDSLIIDTEQNTSEELQEKIKSCISKPLSLTKSNFFTWDGSDVSGYNKTSEHNTIQFLFKRTYACFRAAKDASNLSATVIHTRAWQLPCQEPLAKLIYTIQLVAARLAEVDEIWIYPEDSKNDLELAIADLDSVEKTSPQMKVHQLIRHIEDKTEPFGMRDQQKQATGSNG